MDVIVEFREIVGRSGEIIEKLTLFSKRNFPKKSSEQGKRKHDLIIVQF
jgi:hypothetical protein